MSQQTPTIAPGSTVTLHFSLALSDGTEAVSTFDEEPSTLTLGDGDLTEGLEQALYGLKAGDKQTLIVEEKDAFGPWNEEMVHLVAREDFAPELELEPGLVIAFETLEGEEVAGIIGEIGDEQVEVDFNHPLSGSDIAFTVQILEVANP
ncbi:MAG: FKBP-type peptidyl-prolyl cis-trans isomerase [Candidatus Sedimenticola sp. (ex Thyasira tokunagai)]